MSPESQNNQNQNLPQQPTTVISSHATPPIPTNPPNIIILQWLTYAFWGWTVLAMSFLTAAVLSNFVDKTDSGSFTIYVLAAILVLLPVSITCDVFYKKHETAKKTGAASIVMVIHAVIFALFAIGSLIAGVFAFVSIFISSGEHNTQEIALFSALIIFVLYSVTFLRTINFQSLGFVRRFYPIFMIIAVGTIGILAFIGPVAYQHQTKDDKLLEQNLPQIETSIDSYARTNKMLPSSLAQLSLSGDTRQIVSRNLIDYTPNTAQPSATSSILVNPKTPISPLPTTTNQNNTYFYQLCVTYKKESQAYKTRPAAEDFAADANGYSTFISTYSHPAGKVCYKLKTNSYTY